MAHLDLDITEGVASLTMNRPEARNALSMEMRAQLIEVLHDIEHNDTVRCVVLKGAGDHFMAGGDVKGMSESIKKAPSDVRKEFLLRIHDLHPIMFAMRRMPKPIIASCRGAAAGAGVSMALACDLVIAAEDAFFTLAYCKIGTSPDGSSSFHLPRAVGIKKAMEIALLGDRFGAQEAKDNLSPEQPRPACRGQSSLRAWGGGMRRWRASACAEAWEGGAPGQLL